MKRIVLVVIMFGWYFYYADVSVERRSGRKDNPEIGYYTEPGYSIDSFGIVKIKGTPILKDLQEYVRQILIEEQPCLKERELKIRIKALNKI